MTPPEVVGTDILFGLVLAVLGSVFHWKFGSISSHVLLQLLEGGLPGVILGCLFARRVPARKLKLAIATIAIFAGLQLIYSGSRNLWGRPSLKAGRGAKGDRFYLARRSMNDSLLTVPQICSSVFPTPAPTPAPFLGVPRALAASARQNS